MSQYNITYTYTHMVGITDLDPVYGGLCHHQYEKEQDSVQKEHGGHLHHQHSHAPRHWEEV